MPNSLQPGSRTAVLLLCMLVAAVSALLPVCPACDDLHPQHGSHFHLIGSAQPALSDNCDGVCSCCGFHWLPSLHLAPSGDEPVAAISSAWAPHYASYDTPPPIQPPRT